MSMNDYVFVALVVGLGLFTFIGIVAQTDNWLGSTYNATISDTSYKDLIAEQQCDRWNGTLLKNPAYNGQCWIPVDENTCLKMESKESCEHYIRRFNNETNRWEYLI